MTIPHTSPISPVIRFGTVFRATLRGEYTVAVKTMRVAKITERELAKFKAELIIMAPLHHPASAAPSPLSPLSPPPSHHTNTHARAFSLSRDAQNLVRLFGGVWNEGADKLCIVLEFCANGSLKSFLKGSNGSWTDLRHGLAVGTAKALAYLHHDLSEPLIHRDVKPDNILVSGRNLAKLADFGESTRFDTKLAKDDALDGHNDALTMTMVGTKLYCAPEVITGQRYNESAASVARENAF